LGIGANGVKLSQQEEEWRRPPELNNGKSSEKAL
jgi:hypothetical protein